MKRMLLLKIFINFVLIFITSCNAHLPGQTYTYMIKTDSDPRDPAPIKCIYKGHVIDLQEGIDFLPETELVSHFTVIITSEHPKILNGTVAHLERDPKIECRWYEINWSKEGTKTTWSITELTEENMPLRIPDDAIIVCYPVKFFEKIEDKTSQDSCTIIHLPSIILKKNLSEEEKRKRDDEITRSILAQVEVNACLTPSKLVKQGNVIKNTCSAPTQYKPLWKN